MVTLKNIVVLTIVGLICMIIGGAVGFKTRDCITQRQEVPLWYIEKIITWVPINPMERNEVVKFSELTKKRNNKLQPKLFKEIKNKS